MVERPGLGKILRALGLMYQLAIMTVGLLLSEVTLILLHHSRYVLLLLLLLKAFNVLHSRVQSMHPHALLRLGGSSAI